MRGRVLYTRHDGGVSVYAPSANCIRWMANGGRWNDMPRGYVDIQIERQIEAGHDPRAAKRFAHALAFGGCTGAEALEIIRNRDCGHLGSAFELVDMLEIPTDRWFRDAWRRSHNGGPIGIAMSAARRIQTRKLTEHAKQHKFEFDWPRWRARIRRASTPEELKSIWPQPRKPHEI